MTDQPATVAHTRRRVRSRSDATRVRRPVEDADAAREALAVLRDPALTDEHAAAAPGEGEPDETEEGPDRSHLVALDIPAEGVPDIVDTPQALAAAVAAISGGTGPIAVDAERASGYRYGQRAYLIQLRRQGSGTWLIDPIACPDLAALGAVVSDAEWVLHAANQDLPCLAELGMTPTRLFDTELGARLAGLPRVGLGAAVEHYLGLSLAKEHSAVDWSTRPLPEPWLRYAALDVEVLVALRDAIHADLERLDRLDWALQEFHALTSFTGPTPRIDPWRRCSGMHRIRTRRGVALVRELWQSRDSLAAERDVSPGRVLPDAVLVELAILAPTSAADLASRRDLRTARPATEVWLAAVARGRALREDDLPPMTLPAMGPPPPRMWRDRDPEAARRLDRARKAILDYATEHVVPAENLLTPDTLRRALWTPPAPLSESAFAERLTELGARPWQVQLTAPMLAQACVTPLTPEPATPVVTDE